MAGEWLPRVTAATQLRHRECELQPPFQSVARDWINQEEIGQSPFTCGCPWAGLGACRHPTLLQDRPHHEPLQPREGHVPALHV